MSDAEEHLVLRAAPPDAGRRHMVANFPLGPPAFRDRPRAPWSLTPRTDAGAPPGSWAIGDGGAGGASHASTREDGLTGGGYFLVVRDGDGGATVVPVDEWHTFRPPVRYKTMTLEEAEAAMESRARGVLPAPTSRLGAALSRAAAADAAAGGGDAAGDGNKAGGGGSDDEGDRGGGGRFGRGGAPARARGVAHVARDAPPPSGGTANDAVDAAAAGAEDWEHVDERDDDDVDMGDLGGGDDGTAAGAPPPAASPSASSGGRPDDADSDGAGTSPGGNAELKRILASTGLGGDSESEEEAGGAAAAARRPPPSRSGSPSDDDDVDLDAMATAIGGAVLAARPSAAAGDDGPAASGKRRADASPEGGARGKRVKSEAPSPGGGEGAPTDAELIAALTERGPMPSAALTALFKARLRAPADRKAFTAAVKRVARLEERPPGSGVKVIVLRG